MTITLTREEAQQVLDALENLASMAGAAWTTDNPIETLRARLAQETPYEIGKRLYQEGKGISFIPTAVERDDQIGEALRGFEDARLEQPEPDYRDVVIKGDLWRIEFLPDHAASVVLVKANYEAQAEPEPVAWMYEFGTDNADAVNEIRWYKNVHLTKPTGMVRNVAPLYTAPPQRKEWQGLTDREIMDACAAIWASHPVEIGNVVQDLLKQKNA